MKFLSKNLLIIFGVVVLLPILLTLASGCYTQGRYGLPGWGCSKSLFYIVNIIPLAGSIAIILLNIFTKKLGAYLCSLQHFPDNCNYRFLFYLWFDAE
jgi:hypothetical protein